jgi:hypothetical protein
MSKGRPAERVAESRGIDNRKDPAVLTVRGPLVAISRAAQSSADCSQRVRFRTVPARLEAFARESTARCRPNEPDSVQPILRMNVRT